MMALERQISNAARWSQRQYDEMFPVTDDAPKRFAWIVESDSATITQNASGEITQTLGFLIAHRIDAEWELENIAVAPSVRRQGIAARLLNELISHASIEHGSAIILEVRESNHPARALYCKLGFEETGLRKSYYSNPREAAILCQLKL